MVRNMLDRFQGMQVLIKTVELGNLSAAARALKMSPTMATKHIAAQEDRLGIRLRHRTTRRVTLTDAGRRYFEVAERIVSELADAETTASGEHAVVRGILRVNVPVSFGVRQIAPLLPRFLEQHPVLSIDLAFNDRYVDLIDEGWDLCVRIGRIAEAKTSLVARQLASCAMTLCASTDYLERRGRPTSIAELRHHECLGYTLSQEVSPEAWSFEANGSVKAPITGRIRASSGDALVEAAIAGFGLTYQPSFMVADALASGKLVELEMDHPPLILGGIFVVYPKDRRPPAKVLAFADYLEKQFRETPPWERIPA